MDARSRTDQLRAASNPLFNDRKLKLGTFCSNLSGGATMSSIDGILQARWPDTLTLARMADEAGFGALGHRPLCRHRSDFLRRRLIGLALGLRGS
jgi:hypothetical protein